uniref:Anti-silencing function 1B histone chaperone n=1 Tax=Capra hircus TaxID=9925 RepID=A0A452EUS6_CAPHI
MAKVSVLSMVVRKNPSLFHSAFWFEISFECNEALADYLEWKIVYIGSAESEFDQILDSVDAPNSSLILETDTLGVTMVLITCSDHREKFIRLCENPPLKSNFSQCQWNILASNPRVNCFHINWDNNTNRLEAIENQDPALGCCLPLSCTGIKGLGLPGCKMGLLRQNSIDFI